jgi:CRISPR-associated protein Cas1
MPAHAALSDGSVVLESQVRIAIAAVGLDPTLGYLHVCQPGRQALVYDLMEPYRPCVDRAVLDFVRSRVFAPRDFVIDSQGACRLHPELARHIATHASVSDMFQTNLTALVRISFLAGDTGGAG